MQLLRMIRQVLQKLLLLHLTMLQILSLQLKVTNPFTRL